MGACPIRSGFRGIPETEASVLVGTRRGYYESSFMPTSLLIVLYIPAWICKRRWKMQDPWKSLQPRIPSDGATAMPRIEPCNVLASARGLCAHEAVFSRQTYGYDAKPQTANR